MVDDPTPIINELRQHVDQWRALPNPSQWLVTPETARLLQHWRHHAFGGVRPFFCQVEAAETAIWLTEVASHTKPGKRILEHLSNANGRGKGGTSTLSINGRKVASGRVERTNANIFSADDAADVGVDEGTNVSSAYPQHANRFTGRIEKVRVEVK